MLVEKEWHVLDSPSSVRRVFRNTGMAALFPSKRHNGVDSRCPARRKVTGSGSSRDKKQRDAPESERICGFNAIEKRGEHARGCNATDQTQDHAYECHGNALFHDHPQNIHSSCTKRYSNADLESSACHKVTCHPEHSEDSDSQCRNAECAHYNRAESLPPQGIANSILHRGHVA